MIKKLGNMLGASFIFAAAHQSVHSIGRRVKPQSKNIFTSFCRALIVSKNIFTHIFYKIIALFTNKNNFYSHFLPDYGNFYK